ncbi:hypothetical protein [Methanopyrus sp.]
MSVVVGDYAERVREILEESVEGWIEEAKRRGKVRVAGTLIELERLLGASDAAWVALGTAKGVVEA